MNFARQLISMYGFYQDFRVQKKYVDEHMLPSLLSLEKEHGGEFSAGDKKKMLYGYCVFVPLILGLNFRRIYGQAFTDEDRRLSTTIALATTVIDDLFDEEGTSIEKIKVISHTPQLAVPDNFRERVAKTLSTIVVNSAADPGAYQSIMAKVIQSQVDSLRQFDPATSFADLQTITFDKSSLSFQLFYAHLVGEISPAFKQVISEVAFLQQTCNDILDIYKDTQQGIVTPASVCTDLTKFRADYLNSIREQNRKIMSLPLPSKNKVHFCFLMNTISATSIPALDQLIKAREKRGNDTDWRNYDRSALIFDREKPKNFVTWLYYVGKLTNMR